MDYRDFLEVHRKELAGTILEALLICAFGEKYSLRHYDKRVVRALEKVHHLCGTEYKW